jgi:predicted metal-dependent phosphoesterase TrpH
MRIDLHTHSAMSDGTDTIPQWVAAAKAADLDAVALTDHDTMEGVDLAQSYGRANDLVVLRGLEMSTHLLGPDGRERSVHLLGYGCRPDDTALGSLLATVRAGRDERVPGMLALLEQLGMPLTLAEVEQQAERAVAPGRPHVADAMIARGYVANRDEAFARYLYDDGPAYVRRPTPTVVQGIEAVNQAGGVAVLAHPWGRGNSAYMTASAITDLARHHGLFGLETDHVDHTEEQSAALRRLADDLGLISTGSSDYHGTGKTRNPLGARLTSQVAFEAITTEIKRRGGLL